METTFQRARSQLMQPSFSPRVGPKIPPVVHEVLRSPGQPLDSATRAFMEPRFGYNFGNVRVHNDTKSADSAWAMNARAYTVGEQIVFGAKQFAPMSQQGRELLAHELAHTIQQRCLATDSPVVHADGIIESSASVAARAVDNGQAVSSHLPATGIRLSRQPAGATEDVERARLAAEAEAAIARSKKLEKKWRKQQTEEDQEEASRQRKMFPPLISSDTGGIPSSSDEQSQVTDEAIAAATGSSAELETAEAEATKGTTPIGVVGPFVVAVGTTRGSVPVKKPPAGIPKIVQGSEDPAVLYHSYSMMNRTGHEGTGLGPDVLAGADEVTLVAHGNQQIVAVGSQHMSPQQLAETLVDAGWQGGTLRLAACETGICAPGNSFAQNLANELKALGAESAVIAPTANVQIVGGKHGLPQIQPPTPPGGQKPPLLPPGEGWEYVVAEERLGWQVERSAFKPGAWKGSAGGAVKLGLMMGLSYLHGEAVAKRVEKETAETGFSEPGPTGSLGYDLGAWILDPTDEAGRSVPFSQRFEMSKNRQTMKEAADRKQPGEFYECSFTTSDGEDASGIRNTGNFTPSIRRGPTTTGTRFPAAIVKDPIFRPT